VDTRHPQEIDLARYVDSHEPKRMMAHHLGWCGSCRSSVADYRWLEGELPSALRAVADAAPEMQPNWPGVQKALGVSLRRSVLRRRLSGALGVGLVMCLVLVASPALETAWGVRGLAAQALPARATVFASVSAEPLRPATTSTPARPDGREAGPSLTQSQMLRPTPPDLQPVPRPNRPAAGGANGA
jgi:hypothetical protein